MKVENVYIKITLRLGSDTTGKPTISTSDCRASISNVRLLFSGKFGYVPSLEGLETLCASPPAMGMWPWYKEKVVGKSEVAWSYIWPKFLLLWLHI